MKSLSYALIACAALGATAGCAVRTYDTVGTPAATTVVVPANRPVAAAPVVVAPAPAPVVVAPAPAPAVVAPAPVVVAPAPAPVVVAPAPAASVVTTETVPWCGGAYAPTAGSSFGSCPR